MSRTAGQEMSKAALRREAQREALIEAAERQIAARSLSGLKARELAGEIGVALGAIYNLVADLDELILFVSSRTLRRLDAAMSADETNITTPAQATARLVRIAQIYRQFASNNLHLWRTLFEHRMPAERALPDWQAADQMRLFRHILAPLQVLRPEMPAKEQELLTRTLFAAVHGVVALGLEEKLVAVPLAALDTQLEQLVRAACSGLRQAAIA